MRSATGTCEIGYSCDQPPSGWRLAWPILTPTPHRPSAPSIPKTPAADRSVAISRIDLNVVAVRALHIAAALIRVVTGAAALAFGGDRSPRAGCDDRPDFGPAAT